VRLQVGGTLTVAGKILANGQDIGGGYGAGGAGGSIHLTAETLAGDGEIRAAGGYGANGGAGGRISLYFSTSTFSGSITAIGGSGGTRGGAGTIYLKPAASSGGSVRVDNGGFAGAQTPMLSPVAFDLAVTESGNVRPLAALNLSSLLVASTGVVSYPGGQAGFGIEVHGNAAVENGGAIVASCALTVHGNLSIGEGGVISANGKGFGTGAGPGKGNWNYYYPSGAGYGGPGGDAGTAGGPVYGSLLQPVDLGSGGGTAGVSGSPGGAGGGALRLTVDGTLTIDGQLSADGMNGTGGGSGGSVLVSAGTLTGRGRISATGGSGSGGGGGGRIALYSTTSTFTGTTTALGGPGGSGLKSGGPGSIFLKTAGAQTGILLIDGTGRDNAMETPITSPEAFDLILTHTTVFSNGPLLLSGLLVKANGMLTHPARGPRLEVTVLGNAGIEADGAIRVDGRGYGSEAGPGAGRGSYYSPSGAGYGGPGGRGTDVVGGHLAGGSIYGSATLPVDLGSGGGVAGVSGALGGSGGGAIQLSVAGNLVVDGQISANGADGAGGGSGGSILLNVGKLAGTGVIRANGGGSGRGCGSGGGGRIAIFSGMNEFTGTTTLTAGIPGTDGHYGGLGTSQLAAHLPPMIVAQSPVGQLGRFVSYVDLSFDQPVDPATFGTEDIVLNTPSGFIPASQLTLSGGGGVTWRIGFPMQSANGDYALSVGPQIANLFGEEMATAYSGGFSVSFTTPAIAIRQTGGTLNLSWPSAVGLSYQLQSSTDLLPENWINEGQPVKGTGELLRHDLTIGTDPKKFYRLLLLED
jgi:hypothetical protein